MAPTYVREILDVPGLERVVNNTGSTLSGPIIEPTTETTNVPITIVNNEANSMSMATGPSEVVTWQGPSIGNAVINIQLTHGSFFRAIVYNLTPAMNISIDFGGETTQVSFIGGASVNAANNYFTWQADEADRANIMVMSILSNGPAKIQLPFAVSLYGVAQPAAAAMAMIVG